MNNEWYTPAALVDAARQVLGEIDLDVASSAKANETVGAKNFYTVADDGLTKIWRGRVFMNPPYQRRLIEKFVDKLLSSDFDAAIVLVNAATETKWFSKLAAACDAVCFISGRIKFIQDDGKQAKKNPRTGSAVFYFGRDKEKFFEIFGSLGLCAKFL